MKNHGGPLIVAKRERKPVYHVQMTDAKRAIIQQLCKWSITCHLFSLYKN